ncbi:MAG TPA: hypothetical protein VJ872_19235 [Nocardioides sp.]|nr:hypothetical protein [Nocardioides sp.]
MDMGVERYDSREFESTFFTLRIGLVVSALVVISAPFAARVFGHHYPPSISDSWYTDARTIFVVALAAGAALLVVVRGDTLTEQTLLNLAGGLGLAVAGAACWPKGSDGKALATYDPSVAKLNEYAVGAVLVVGAIALVASYVLPKRLVGSDPWHTKKWAEITLRALPAALLAYGAIRFLSNERHFAEHVHGPASVVMFALLGIVALLRTRWGLRVLDLIDDTPVDDSLSSRALPQERSSAYDVVYAAVGVLMLVVVAVAAYLVNSHHKPGWILWIEISLLLLFCVFWSTQTVEGWQENKTAGD